MVGKVNKQPVLKHPDSLETAKEMYLSEYGQSLPAHSASQKLAVACKIAGEYEAVKDMGKFVPAVATPALRTEEEMQLAAATAAAVGTSRTMVGGTDIDALVNSLPASAPVKKIESTAMVEFSKISSIPEKFRANSALILEQRRKRHVIPEWHAPWKLMRVISGHLGWVRAICVDPCNEWFATGSADRTIKIWDMASGTLKLTLTGHINCVRGLAVSSRSPYMFSAAEDKTVKCWDLEYNKVIRNYHGHLSGVYSLELHPTIDVMITGGRDSVARVWDIRTKAQVRVLAGHKNTVGAIQAQTLDPQVITGSHDCTIKLWDLATGKTISTLTNHKKSIRALQTHHTEYTFCSGSSDNMKVWKCPDGEFLRNIAGQGNIVNCLTLNKDNVLVAGGDDGSLRMYDWASGTEFQNIPSIVQPGSMDSEAGIFAAKFDVTQSRLITCEGDKTIKMWKEDETATPETHPVQVQTAGVKKARY